MTKINMAGWSQDQIANWQDPMLSGMQQGPKGSTVTGLPWGGMLSNIMSGIKPSPYDPAMTGNPDFPVAPPPSGEVKNPIVEGGIAGLGSLPNYDDKFAGFDKQFSGFNDKFAGFDKQIGGFDNQFKDIVGRLDKLEQGLGSFSGPASNQTPSVTGPTGIGSMYAGNNSRGY